MLFLQISKHSPELCPVNNEKSMKSWHAYEAKREQLIKKHGIKVIGSWHDAMNHRLVTVWDGTIERVMDFCMEPEMLAYGATQTHELVPVTTYEESVKLFMK